MKAAYVEDEQFALQDKLSETIYGTNFAQLVGGTESSIDAGKEKSQASQAESPKLRSPPSAPAETEVVLSRYASQDKIGPTIDSTAAVSNFKQLKVLYGDGDDVFSPRLIKVKATELLSKINKEQANMDDKRPF